MIRSTSRASAIFLIYILGFVLTLSVAMPTYIDSSFLGKFSVADLVGSFYVIASIIAAVLFALIPKILARFGNYKTTIALLAVLVISYSGLAAAPALIRPGAGLLFAIGLFFAGNFVSSALLGFSLDAFLENYSSDSKTGGIRGAYLTIANSAWVLSPLIMGMILTGGDYWKIYLGSALLVLPVIGLVAYNFRNFKDPEYAAPSARKTWKKILASNDGKNIFAAGFLLQFFYAMMVIYTPIYLHSNIGLSWTDIGVVFSVMLLPFVMIELPLGKLADKKYGEKEMMSIGFAIMAISTGLISFISGNNLLVWMAILFATRIGAAMAEVMTETYFFKKVDREDITVISAYRAMRPLAYIIAPIVAFALFEIAGIEFKYIFLALGFIMFCGLNYSLGIKDTK